MIVVEKGFAYLVTREGFKEFAKARAAGQDHSIGQFATAEIGDLVGDVTDFNPQLAKLALMAMENHAEGLPLVGKLATFAEAVEALDGGMLGELPAWEAA